MFSPVVYVCVFAGCLTETCQLGVCVEENKSRCSINCDTLIELAQVCSRFVFDETFEPRLNFVRFTRHVKKRASTRNFMSGDFQ